MIDAAGHYRVLRFASTLALCQATQYDSPTGVRSHSAARSENCLALHEPEQSTGVKFLSRFLLTYSFSEASNHQAGQCSFDSEQYSNGVFVMRLTTVNA